MATGVPVNRISTDQQQLNTASQQAAAMSQQAAAACAAAAGSAATAAVDVNSTATAARMSFLMVCPSGMKQGDQSGRYRGGGSSGGVERALN